MTKEIIEFGVVSLKNILHLIIVTLPVDTLFVDTFKETSEGLDINIECLNIMDKFDNRLKVQESFNSEQRVLERAQEMAEVQNLIGHRKEPISTLLIKDQ